MKKEKMKKMYFISTTYVVREFQVPPKRGNMLGSRKEVFQPHLPVSGTPGSHGLTGGVYKARERIHRAMADARLLANPASWSRVADSNPN